MTYKSFTSGMFVAVVCSGVALSSFAQEVYSPNVVGFQKVTVVSSNLGGLFLGSTPFNQEQPYIDRVVGTNGVAAAGSGSADNVIIYNKSNQLYTTYWLYSNAAPSFNRRWRSGTGFATNVYLTPGMGYWYLSRASSNTTLILAGEAVDQLVVTNTIVPGLQILSYPFSANVRISDLTLTNGVAAVGSGSADNIILYEPTNALFTTYWLYSNAAPSFNRRWRSGTGFATNVFIKSGEGFWYQSRTSTNLLWIETRPYTF